MVYQWYTDLHTRMTEIAKPSTEGYYRTKHELLFKVTMLLALSEGFGLQLLPGHFEMAEKWFFKPMEKNLEKVFEGSGLNPNAAAATQICHMLEQLDRPMGGKPFSVCSLVKAVRLTNSSRLSTISAWSAALPRKTSSSTPNSWAPLLVRRKHLGVTPTLSWSAS
jgi:hypothetical protein